MDLKHQVCSLEFSKRLKELGVRQVSYFSWYEDSERDDEPALNRSSGKGCPTCQFPLHRWHSEYSAFTIAELGEMLPGGYVTWWYAKQDGRVFRCARSVYDHEQIACEAPTEADARAKMLIYLVENKLLDTQTLTDDSSTLEVHGHGQKRT